MRMGQSEEFQQFNSKRNIDSGYTQGSDEATNTTTILKDN